VRSANSLSPLSSNSNRKFTYGRFFKMAVQLTPLHDRVIVKRIEEKESVKGGIIIPDSAKEKPWRAKSSPSALVSARRAN